MQDHWIKRSSKKKAVQEPFGYTRLPHQKDELEMIKNITMEETKTHVDPCALLLLAVIKAARDDAVRKPERDRIDAREWVRNSSTFVLYCKLIGLNPDTVRERLIRQWKAD